jgi:membrane protein
MMWKVITRIYDNIHNHSTGLIAAGVAFYFFLAIFPALAMLISIYGLIADPSLVTDQIGRFSAFLPGDVVHILSEQAFKISSSDNSALGLGLLLSTGLTLYAASRGVNALIVGLNIAYGTNERRNIVAQNLLAIGLTFVILAAAILVLWFVAILPALLLLLDRFHLVEIGNRLMALRWPIMFLTGLTMLDILYRYGPDRADARWRWLSGGALLATVLWVGVSWLFSWYVVNFGNYNETYGTLGAVIVLLTWLWLSAGSILLGAELNAIFEHNDRQILDKPALQTVS